jgi:ABC-type amino acid transport system permease subunit
MNIVDLLFNPLSNAIMTVSTGVTVLYWIFNLIFGSVLGDGDLDASGIDTDVDADADPGDLSGEGSNWDKLLAFVNVGKVPFMIVLSVFKLIAWIITLASSIVLNLVTWGWMSVFILIPVVFIAFIITRFATKPLIKLYHAMGYNGEEAYDLLGRSARMLSTISNDTIGFAELKVQGDVVRINVKSKTGESIRFDAEVMIMDESPDKKYYIVVPEINLANIV